MLIFIWHCVLMKMMAAIKLYHLSDGLLLSFYPAHATLILSNLFYDSARIAHGH
jgi:hypothetical protein